MHLDKDEALWKSEGVVKAPIIGTVFYPVEMDIEGGYLEIFSNGPDNEPERIQAKHNRLIIFDAGNTHHRVTTVTKGTRSAIAINLWDEAPTTELKFEAPEPI
jgi:predicted 2-oxoglutarate/Fe(II)-dependent dioxygenase YbiX